SQTTSLVMRATISKRSGAITMVRGSFGSLVSRSTGGEDEWAEIEDDLAIHVRIRVCRPERLPLLLRQPPEGLSRVYDGDVVACGDGSHRRVGRGERVHVEGILDEGDGDPRAAQPPDHRLEILLFARAHGLRRQPIGAMDGQLLDEVPVAHGADRVALTLTLLRHLWSAVVGGHGALEPAVVPPDQGEAVETKPAREALEPGPHA